MVLLLYYIALCSNAGLPDLYSWPKFLAEDILNVSSSQQSETLVGLICLSGNKAASVGKWQSKPNSR